MTDEEGLPPRKRILHGEFSPYEERPDSRSGLVVAAVILLLASGSMFYLNLRERAFFQSAEIGRQYERSSHTLEQTRSNLKELMAYIDDQSAQLRSTNKLLVEMQQERDRLQPMLDTDINAVNALFQAQEKRLQKDRWWETIGSFFLGVVSSIAASFIWEWFRKWQRTRPSL
jgi:septal ring factor EnvC (AmiA/AmiB activator)